MHVIHTAHDENGDVLEEQGLGATVGCSREASLTTETSR
jgi:hypothetical protein